MLFDIVLLDLVPSVLSQEMGYEERLHKTILCRVEHKNLTVSNLNASSHKRCRKRQNWLIQRHCVLLDLVSSVLSQDMG